MIVAGALPLAFGRAREQVFELAARAGYPIVAEAASQLRFGARPDGVMLVDHFDLIPVERRPHAALVVQLGAQPVAASWASWLAHARPARWVLAGPAWHDPEASAREVILGDLEPAVAALAAKLRELPAPSALLEPTALPSPPAPPALPAAAAARSTHAWRDAERRAAAALEVALAAHADNEAAIVRAALDAVPGGATVQLGNSLPIRVVDHACAGGAARGVIAQRGAAGIDGLIASAAGATRAGRPVLLVLGDVSFAHDLGGLLAARLAAAPLAILVIDNGGGQIFAGLPVARAPLGAAFEACWLTPPAIDPAAVARLRWRAPSSPPRRPPPPPPSRARSPSPASP